VRIGIGAGLVGELDDPRARCVLVAGGVSGIDDPVEEQLLDGLDLLTPEVLRAELTRVLIVHVVAEAVLHAIERPLVVGAVDRPPIAVDPAVVEEAAGIGLRHEVAIARRGVADDPDPPLAIASERVHRVRLEVDPGLQDQAFTVEA
jgi:hypothetical protein